MKGNLEEILMNLKNSSKYKEIDEEFIKLIGDEQFRKRKNLKEAIKHTRSKLHQVGAVYFDGKIDYLEWLTNLASCEKEDLPLLCSKIMLSHVSTRERLPILEDFYYQIFSQIPEPMSVMDLACGLNPLSVLWMKLNPKAKYYAYDIYEDLARFINGFFSILGVSGEAHSSDILSNPPKQQVDVALLLKAIPCLEQIKSNAGNVLLEQIPAKIIVVSFPVKSLTGRNKGMLVNYDDYFQAVSKGKNWDISKLIFSTELVYIVRK